MAWSKVPVFERARDRRGYARESVAGETHSDTANPEVANSVCPGCGLELPGEGLVRDARYNASGECRRRFDDLSFWTLARRDAQFVHQYAVDAYAAQHARVSGPTISAAFPLVGLYLAVEKGWSGRQVQRTHQLLATRAKEWPRFLPPADLGTMTVLDVVGCARGPDRGQALLRWCASVWDAWKADHERVRLVVEKLP